MILHETAQNAAQSDSRRLRTKEILVSKNRGLRRLTTLTAGGAGTVAFLALYHLRNDSNSGSGDPLFAAAIIQPLPYLAAAILTVFLRNRTTVLCFVLAAVAGCGLYGWWLLRGLEEVRPSENDPLRGNAVFNILTAAKDQLGLAEFFLWPVIVTTAIGCAAMLGWVLSQRSGSGRGSRT